MQHRGFLTAPAAVAALLITVVSFHVRAAAPTLWETRGVGGGGALYSPSFSPHNPDEMYLACDMSGLYHTTSLGASWALIDFRTVQGSRGARVQFTSDPQLLYVIDYSAVGGSDFAIPSVSTDGGTTWTGLPGDPTGADAWSLFADYSNPDRILITDYSRLYFSSDGGLSFQLRYTAQDAGAGCHVAGVFWDGQSIYVGTNDGLLISGNGGASFALASVAGIPATEAMISFAGSKEGAAVRFFAVTGTAGSVYAGIDGSDHWIYQGVYSLDWGQPAWELRTDGIRFGDHPWYVGMTGGDISTAYLAGGSDISYPIVYRWDEAEQDWKSAFIATGNTNIATGWSGYRGDSDWWYGEFALGFAVSPVDKNRAAFSDLGFIHLTTDGGVSWRQAYLTPADENPAGQPTPKGRNYRGVGLENTSVWDLVWSDAEKIFACFTDVRGIRTTDGGRSWSFNYTGHTENTMYRAVRHADGTLYAGTSTVHDLYQSTYLADARIDGGGGRVLYSSDGGASWQLLHDFGHPVVWVALDPDNPTRLYASVVHSADGGIYFSNDIQNGAGSSWNRLAAPPRTEGHPFNIVVLEDGTLVVTYSGRRDAGGAFTASSGVFASTDGGQTWQDRSDPGMRYWTKDILVDPHDAQQNTWYVGVFSGWGGPSNGLGGLYRSRDRGQTWTRIYETHRVDSCSISPVNPEELYFTTETDGLWYTDTLNQPAITWTQTTYPFRHPVRVFFNPYDPGEIWVTSFGNGLRVAKTGGSPGADLLRNTEVTAIAPVTPALATILPLDSLADLYQSGFLPGSTEPDGGILTRRTQPLTFYGLAGSGVLKLVKVTTDIAIFF
jgi:photosystem II stability/assembly factor-like uncharacterized protein